MTPPKRHKFLERPGTARRCEICGMDVQRAGNGWAWTRRGVQGTATTLTDLPTHATLKEEHRG